jgi:hypothetical protein
VFEKADMSEIAEDAGLDYETNKGSQKIKFGHLRRAIRDKSKFVQQSVKYDDLMGDEDLMKKIQGAWSPVMPRCVAHAHPIHHGSSCVLRLLLWGLV